MHKRLADVLADKGADSGRVLGGLTAALGLLLLLDFALPGDNAALHLLSGTGLAMMGLVAILGSRNRKGKARSSRVALTHLQEEKQAAQSASQMKSRYLASLSHEIRSPLNAIYGYAQLVERDDGVEVKEAAKVIRRCAEHLNSLVDGLLDITQLEKGVLRLKPDLVELGPFIEQIVSMVRPGAAAKGIAFEYRTEGRLPRYVRVDQIRLRQVLINLLSNAIKFTDSGSVTLCVAYRAQMARFEITDTGAGIAAEDRERIFDPFERGPEGNRPGVGLGLPIAKAIVDILGGKLELDSRVGEGTTFAIVLLLPEVAGKLEHRAASRHVTGYLGKRRTVLVAEDNEEQLGFMSRLLTSLGFEVIAAPDGETALLLSQGRPVDIAILDIAMPGISGWQTAVELRKRLDQDMRIVMLSGNAQELHRPDFPVPVHDLFLVKPVEFGALIESIGGLLEISWTWVAEPLPSTSSEGSASLNDAARAHVARLSEFLRIGYLRGIEDEIRRLEAADPAAKVLVGELIECLDRFDLSAMSHALEAA